MSFTPKQPELSAIDTILYNLSNDGTDPKLLSQEELAAYRLSLAAIKKAVGAKMAETSTKEHIYDIDEVTEYIDAILKDGFNLNETELSDYPEFIDAQKLTRWSDLIAERVEASMFGAKKFKVHSLRFLRTNIARSKTLHDLRQAVTMMIGPLQLWNDHCVLVQKTSHKQVAIDNKETDQYIDSLLLEIEEKDKLLAQRKRVIDEIYSVYSESDSDIDTLRNIESAKKEHNLSDTQAAKMFGISRTKLTALRESIDLNASPADPDAVPVQAVVKDFPVVVQKSEEVIDANDFTIFPDRLDDLGF
jgi:hypothetical protein